MVSVACPKCTKAFRAPPEAVGHTARCRKCGATFTVVATTPTRPQSRTSSPQQSQADGNPGSESNPTGTRPKSSGLILPILTNPSATMSLPADAARSGPTSPKAGSTGEDAGSTRSRSGPPLPASSRDPLDGSTPAQIGRFEVRGWVGEGSFAEVYLGYDRHLDREVAIKVAKPGTLGSPRRVKRFLREARAAGNLRHPNIVPLFETGEDNGRPFLVSAFIRGRTLGAAIKEFRDRREVFDYRVAVRIVRKLASALAYAHDEGIVHRDLKPDNVMLDEKGEPLLMDFGLAARTEPEGEERLSRDGLAIGTPAYMSPEQARADLSQVGPAADQYAVGCTLYELLTGQTPFAGPPPVQLLLHQTKDPVRPSRFNKFVPPDLDAICLKCLAKDPKDRYASAADLAEDLDRFLRGEPVLARRQTLRYLAGKFVRRYKQSLAITAVILLSALGGTATAFFKINHERTLALNASREASDAKTESQGAYREALSAQNEKQKAYDELAQQSYDGFIALAERELATRNDVGLADSLLRKCPEKYRGWEWYYLSRLRDSDPIRSDPKDRHDRGIWSVSYSPDGRQFATSSIDSTVRVWDAATGNRLLTYKGHSLPLPASVGNVLPVPNVVTLPDPTKLFPFPIPKPPLPGPQMLPEGVSKALPIVPVTCVAFSPDGRSVASGSAAPSGDPLRPKELRGVVRIWDPDTGKDILTFANQVGIVLSLAYSPDGKRIASSSINDDNSFVVWDAKTGAVIKVIRGHTSHVHRLRYSPDGKLIASVDTDGMLRLWDANTFEVVRASKVHSTATLEAAFSPKGDRIATGGTDGTVRVWDVVTGAKVFELRGHYGTTMAIVYSPDGQRIATSGFDNTVRLWDAANGQEKLTLRGHSDMVWGVAFSPDGSKIVSASFDCDFRIWDTVPRSEPTGPGLFTITGPADRVNVLAFNRNDSLLVTGGWDNTVRLWDGHTGAPRRTLSGHTTSVFGVAFDPRGERIASSSWDHTVKVWETATGRELLTFHGHKAPVQSVAFSPDGRRIASTGWDGRVLIWDAATGENTIVCDKFLGIAAPTVCVAFSPDGRRIATGRTDRLIIVWDAESGRELFTLEGHEGAIPCVRFSPDGKLLASAGWDLTAKIWDVSDRDSGRLVTTIKGHTDRVHGVAFSPDGSRLATVGDDKTVRVWDPKTGKEIESLRRQHRAGVWSVEFTHDGKRLATACWSPSGWVKTWDVTAGR